MKKIEAGDYVLHLKKGHLNNSLPFLVLQTYEDCALCEYFDIDLSLKVSIFDFKDLRLKSSIADSNS